MTEYDELIAALGDAVPAYATRPTEGAPNDLKAIEVIGEALGTPLIPWQRLAARLISERRIDDPRRYRYPLVIITTPRQVGKTTGFRVIQTQRSFMKPNRRSFYTAQTGKDARARWKDLVTALTDHGSPFKNSVTIKLGAGDAGVTFTNGSEIRPFAPTPESLHGYTPHDVAVDEAFAFDEAEGAQLMGAIVPAQQTIADRQTIIFSTKGNRQSTWLKGLITLGRQAVEDPAAQVAYLEWSLPDGADDSDPNSWTFHPGLNHLITIDDLTQLRETLPRSEWLRAIMNIETDDFEFTAALTDDQVLDVEGTQTPVTDPRSVAIGYEVALDRSRSVIAAAWYDPNSGLPAVKIIERGAGTDHLVPSILDAYQQKYVLAIGADDGGATRDISDQIRKAGRAPRILTAREYATACEAFIARVKDRRIILDPAGHLREPIAGAATRPLSQSIAFDRSKSITQIPELIAAVVALRLLENEPKPAPKPKVSF